MIRRTLHFEQRKKQRGLREEVLRFIIDHGEMHPAKGAAMILVEKRRLPSGLKESSLAHRAAQWLLIMKDTDLITCYRSRKPIRYLLAA